MKLLFEASAPVRAAVQQIRGLIDDEWVIDVMIGARRSYLDVDHRDGVVGFQGHWWYRGEIDASESGGTTVVTYRVYNIAPRGTAWAVPLANRLFIGYGRTVRQGAAGLAQALEAHLDGLAS
jgi:hypothetical protein